MDIYRFSKWLRYFRISVYKAALFCLAAAFCLGLAACAAKPSSENPDAAETTALYQTPATRIVADDPALFESAQDAQGPMIYFETQITELRSPVAILMWEKNAGEYCFANTDTFETTTDVSSAASVLYVEIRETYDILDNEIPLYDYGVEYDCYLITRDCTAKIYFSIPGIWMLQFSPDETVQSNSILFNALASKENDEAFFQFLARRIRIAPDASDDVPVALEYAAAFTPGRDIQTIRQACGEYSYPAEANLSLHPELLDTMLPIMMYRADKSIAPTNNDPSDYLRTEEVLSAISVEEIITNSCNEDTWAKVARKERARLIGFTEFVGAEHFADYSDLGALYLHIYRCTVIDSETGEVVAWYRNDPSAGIPTTITSNQIHKHGERRFFDGSIPDLRRSFLEEFY